MAVKIGIARQHRDLHLSTPSSRSSRGTAAVLVGIPAGAKGGRGIDYQAVSHRFPADDHGELHGVTIGEAQLYGPTAGAYPKIGGYYVATLPRTAGAGHPSPVAEVRLTGHGRDLAFLHGVDGEAYPPLAADRAELDIPCMERGGLRARIELGLDGGDAEARQGYPFPPAEYSSIGSFDQEGASYHNTDRGEVDGWWRAEWVRRVGASAMRGYGGRGGPGGQCGAHQRCAATGDATVPSIQSCGLCAIIGWSEGREWERSPYSSR